MKRLEKIGQSINGVFSDSNSVQNRLEHCKGAYQKILDFYMLQFFKDEWREKNNNQDAKLKILADLMDMASHDIGHNICSHALEGLIGEKGAHEIIGERILHENEEVIRSISNIHPDLLKYLDIVKDESYCLHSLKEGNVDFDRADFLSRDSIYFEVENGFNGEEESIPVIFDKINNNCKICTVVYKGKKIKCPVYSYEVVSEIETFLKRRLKCYEKKYTSKENNSYDYMIEKFCEMYLKYSKTNFSSKFKAFLGHLNNSSTNNMDLNRFLNWNDIKFYNSLFDIVDSYEDNNLRNFARLCIPPVQALIGIVQTRLFPHINPQIDEDGNEKNLEDEFKDEEDRKFYKRVKKIVQTKDKNYYQKDMSKECFGVYFTTAKERDSFVDELERKYGICKDVISTLIEWDISIQPYNPNQPIFILGEDNKIYTFDEYPGRKLNIEPQITYGIFGIDSKCLLEGVSSEKINKLRMAFNSRKNRIGFGIHKTDSRLFSEIIDRKAEIDSI